MTTTTIIISSQGQVVIPKEIRDELHWETGQQLIVETTPSGLLLKSTAPQRKVRLEDLRGFLKYDGPQISTELLCKSVDYADYGQEPGNHGQ